MIPSATDPTAIVKMFSQATARQSEVLRQAVSAALAKSMQGRELTAEGVKQVLKAVTQAASLGAAKTAAPPLDIEALVSQALANLDASAYRTLKTQQQALQQLVDQSSELHRKQIQAALDNVEQMETMFFDSLRKAVHAASSPMLAPWHQVLGALRMNGSTTGPKATEAIEQLITSSQATVSHTRSINATTALAMIDAHAALVGGLLRGMSEGLQRTQGKAQPKPK